MRIKRNNLDIGSYVMNIKDIDNKMCNCGRVHKISIKEVFIESGILKKLSKIFKEHIDKRKIYIIEDENTKKAAGEFAAEILRKEFEVIEIVLAKKSKNDHLEPDTDSLFDLMNNINADDSTYLIACGSGTLNDLTAFAAYKMGLPYSVIATAPSMDGYASSVSSITVNGVKQTYNTNPPELIIADLNVLSEAPWEMIQSGLGDLLGKVSSLLEWKLGVALYDEYFCQKAFDLVKDVLDVLFAQSDKIIKREEEGIKILTEGLINSGLAMMMVGSSRPASGTEHHISHFFDMYAGIYNKDVPPHGIKVGTALVISSYFYRKLLIINFKNFVFEHDWYSRKNDIKKIYGDKADSIINLLEQRWEDELLTADELISKEEDIKNNIREFKYYLENVESILLDFDFFKREDLKKLNRDWLFKAINYSFELRFRYTVSTLLSQVGLLDKWGEEALKYLEGYLEKDNN